jgi:hypothetical protein
MIGREAAFDDAASRLSLYSLSEARHVHGLLRCLLIAMLVVCSAVGCSKKSEEAVQTPPEKKPLRLVKPDDAVKGGMPITPPNQP